MPVYDVYLESGPQKKKTLAHVLDPLGCVAFGATSDEAFAATADAIRAYLRALSAHGEKVDPKANVELRLAKHDLSGSFPGQTLWPPDLEPLPARALARYVRWLEWSRADLLALVKPLDEKHLRAKPSTGRSVRDVLLHVLEADKAYVYALVGVHKPMGDPTNAAAKGALDLRVALAEARAAAVERLAKLTPAELGRVRKAGKSTVTAHRMIRRMLEHEWEHRVEIARRIAATP